MRLLRLDADCGFSLVRFSRDDIPPYAILSHTWGTGQDEEVTYKDLVEGTGNDKPGYKKLQFCAEKSQADGLQFFWVDTCCIDKSNTHELTTAINSMYRWYHNAAVCYAYLTDVSFYLQGGKTHNVDWELDFRKSRWFTRGWTLQELLAPRKVGFYSQDRIYLGDRTSLQHSIHEITGIATRALGGCRPSEFTADDILQWKQNRQTTEEEDMAYCLLGLFDVSMPLIYGEGYERAIKRLLREVSESGRPGSQTPVIMRLLSWSTVHRYLRAIPGSNTVLKIVEAEHNLWATFIAVSCYISFYWTVVAISFYLTRLLYQNLPSYPAGFFATLTTWRYSTILSGLLTIMHWYLFLVAVLWCSALTPLHLITPACMDIWSPYMGFLPSPLSESLESLPLQGDFRINLSNLDLFPSGTGAIQSIFDVPKPRNRNFIQRSSIMSLIEKKLRDKPRRSEGRVILHGLGGIGKTHCALEYSYRMRDRGVYGHIFWVSGEPKQFVESYYRIASKANLTVSRSSEQQSMEAVQQWLELNGENYKPWLLVVDGLDDVNAPIFQFLPNHGGQMLLTGRSEGLVARFGDPKDGIFVDKMEYTEAKQLFAQLSLLSVQQDSQEVDYLLEQIERLPLAILQAATFIRHIRQTKKRPILWYIQKFKESLSGQQDLLSRSHKTMYIDADASSGVMTTWKITFDHLASEHPNAAILFKMMVYLSPIHIPADIFQAQIPEELDEISTKMAKQNLPPFIFKDIDVQEALGTLVSFSFLSYSIDETHFQIHRLVRLAMLVELEYKGEPQPFTQISMIMALTFPQPELSNVMKCSRLFPHVEELISQRNMATAKETVSQALRLNLLLRSMIYLRLHGRKKEALQLAGRIVGEKETLFKDDRVCDNVIFQFNIQLLHAASMAYNDLESYAAAKELGDLEYRMLRGSYGEAHPRTLQSLNHLAWVETLPEGDHQLAKQNFERIIQRTQTPQLRIINTEAKRGLAMLLRDMKQTTEAFHLLSEAVEATGETYGKRSVEFAIGLTDLADMQWTDTINQKMEAGENKARALPILLEHLGPEHTIVLQTAYRVAVFIIHFDHSQLDYAEQLFRNLVQSAAAQILQSDMDPIEMMDGLATVLSLRGGAEALEEAVCLMQTVVIGFQRHKGNSHPRTKEAQSDLSRIEADWRKAINGRNRKPRASRWLQAVRGVAYDPQRTC